MISPVNAVEQVLSDHSQPLRPTVSPKNYNNQQMSPHGSMAYMQERENQVMRDEIRMLNNRLDQIDNQCRDFMHLSN